MKFLKVGSMGIMMVIFFLLAAGAAGAADPLKIGYLEGGRFWVFDEIVQAVKSELGHNSLGKEVTFPADASFSAGWGESEKLAQMARTLMAREDLDLVFVAGGDATRAILKANNHRVPIYSIGVTDPVKMGFVKDATDSGVDNFTTRIVPGRYERMFSIFHDVVRFKKLGLLYPDTQNGRLYANADDAIKVATERGFEIVEYPGVGKAESTEDCRKGLEWLMGQGMDAFFMPSMVCFDWKESDVASLLDLLTEHKIPVFAREGTRYVMSGALMGFSSIDFSGRARFITDNLVKIFEGEKPRSLPMVDAATPKISFNLAVAQRIGFDPPFDILAASDELFQEITLPEDRLVK